MRRVILMLMAIAVIAAPCGAATPEELRKIVDANKDAIVSLQLVVEMKMTYEGQTEKEEHKGTITGTVIDPSGLAVASLTEIDPSAQWAEFATEKSSVVADVTSVKIKLGDGTEIPADVVLRDKDLDLAFVKPKQAPEKPLPFIDLSQSSSPQMLDEVLSLGKLGKNSGYATGATLERVVAVVSKPRTFYVLTRADTGGPVLTPDGKVVGIALWRVGRSRSDENGDNWQIMTLPAATVAKGAEQAKSAAPAK